MKALHGSEPGRRRSAAGLHASLDSLYRTARSARQVRIRVTRVPAGAAATTLPALRIRHHHRPRPTAQAGPRRTPRLDLGTARSVPPVWRNLHHPSCLVAAVRPHHQRAEGESALVSTHLRDRHAQWRRQFAALMQLMGHAKIQTTLEYVQISSQDVFQQYARAVAQQIRRIPAAQS